MNIRTRFTCILLVLLTSQAVLASDENDQWTRFQNGGIQSFESNLSSIDRWGKGTDASWQIALKGYGQSSPVVSGDLVYVTSVLGDQKQKLVVTAISLESGNRLWERTFANASPEKNTNYVSRAAPSPVCDPTGVIALFEGGNLVSLSKEGEIRWELNLVKKFGTIKARHGLAASLESDGRKIFVSLERSDRPLLLAIDKKHGKVLWTTAGIGVTTWASPRLINVGKTQHLLLGGSGKIVGLNPENGKRLWSFSDVSGNTTQTPIPVGNGRFVIGASSGRDAGNGQSAKSNALIQVKPAQAGFDVQFVWQAKQATSSFGSPLVHRNRVYFVNRSGVVFCLDLTTGKQLFAGRVKESVWATPLGIGKFIGFFGKDGTTTILRAGDELKKIAENSLWTRESPAPSSPSEPNVVYASVFVNKSLLLRTGNRLFCFGDKRNPK